MSTLLSRITPLKYLFVPCFLMALALFLNACGGEEEAPVEETAPAVEVAPPVVETVPALEMGEIVPSTLSALRFMPAEAQMAIGIPPLTELRDLYHPLLQALQPSKDMDEELAEAIFDLGDGIGVQAETIEELAAALGVDAQAPVAIFVDVAQTLSSALAAKEADDASKAPEEEGVSTPEDETEVADYLDDADKPLMALVFGLGDATKVRERLNMIINEDEKLSALPAGEETIDGIVVQTRGDQAYFLTDSHLVLGSLSLVKGAALRVNNPAHIRYGSVECPATDKDEIALLVYGSRFLPLLEKAIPLLMSDVDDAALPVIQSQLETYQNMFAGGVDEDPMVGTLSYKDDTIEFLVRADMIANPGLLEVSGPAQPLRLARYLPDHTLTMLSIRFNEVFKAQLMEQILPAAQAGGAGDLSMAAQIVPQLGDELTLGITDVKDGEAEIYLLLGLAQPEATQGLLQMFLPMEGGTEYKGYMINSVPAPSPIPLYLSFVDDFALVGTSEEGMKAVIDRHIAKEVSGYFAAMSPLFDIEVPRYQTLTFDTKVLGAPVNYLVGSFGGDIGEEPYVKMLSQVVKTVRTSKDLEDGWLKGYISVQLNDLDSIRAAANAYEAANGEGDAEEGDAEEGDADSSSDSDTGSDSESSETPQ